MNDQFFTITSGQWKRLEHFPIHFMELVLPDDKLHRQHKKRRKEAMQAERKGGNRRPLSSGTQKQKCSMRYWQIKFSNMSKELCTITKQYLFQGYEATSAFRTQWNSPDWRRKQSHHYINWCRNNIWQNFPPLHDKNSQRNRNARELPLDMEHL